MVHLVDQLLTHRFTQSVTLATGEVCQQTRQKHDLFLIDCNAVSIFQIFFHYGNIILDRLTSVLTVDKVGNVVHRSRTIQGVHGDQVFKLGRLQLLQIFLHTCRFKLECSGCFSGTIQFVCFGIFQADMVDIEDMTGGKPYVFDSFFDDGQGFQSQKVHLDQSGLFNYRTFILGYEHFFAGFLVFRGTYRYDIGYIVTTDNNTTGMYPGISYVTFQHLCIFQCVACQRIISGGGLFQFRYVVDCIFQFELLHIRDLIRYQFRQAVRF